MPLIRDEGIVAGRLDYSETSQILVLFTREHGKVRAIAKGAKRSTKSRFSPGIDLLEVGTVIISVRHERAEGLATLTEWKQSIALLGLRERLERIHAAQYAAEITTRLTEDWDPHPQLYDALLSALQEISNESEVLPIIVRFQLALLDQIGLLPRFDACVSCASEHPLTHFSALDGGLICRNCEVGRMEKWEVSAATIEGLRGLQEGRSLPPAPQVEQAAFSLLNYHLAHLIGAEPRVADLVLPRTRRRTV